MQTSAANFTTGLIAHSNTVYCGPTKAAPPDLIARRDFTVPDPAGTHQRVTAKFAAIRLRNNGDIYACAMTRFAAFLEAEASGVPA